AIFQPHTAHRTMSMLDEFAGAFEQADHVIIVPTYRPPGREVYEDDPSVTALLDAMNHPDRALLPAERAADRVAAEAQPGELVLVMGAGDVWMIEPRILAGLAERG